MNKVTDIGIVVVAAGSSSRFGEQDKLTLDLNSKPLFTHCIETFSKIVPIENIIVVASEERIDELKGIIKETLDLEINVTAGGNQRSDSSLNGLKALPNKLKYAAVHDAARPFLSAKSFKICYDSLVKHGSAVLAHPVTDTIKVVSDGLKVQNTPARDTLFAAETPQMFIRKELIDAYTNKPADINVTDEAMAMEISGHEVYLAIHEEDNRKITYIKDIEK